MEELNWLAKLENLFVKVLIPALVGVSINLAITSRKKTMSIFNIVMSVIVGVGMAWMFSFPIGHFFSEDWQSPMIALVGISGDKIANWLIYRFNVDKFIDLLIDWYRK